MKYYPTFNYEEYLKKWRGEAKEDGFWNAHNFDLYDTIDRAKLAALGDTLFEDRDRRYYYKMKNVEEFVEEISKIKKSQLQDEDSVTNDSYFSESESYDEGLERIKDPHKFYKEEVDEVYAEADKAIKLVSLSIKDSDTYDYDVTGDYLDIGRHLDGFPDSFVRGDYRSMKQVPFIKLIVGHNYVPARMDARRVVEYAKNISTLVATLHLKGFPVAVEYAEIGQCTATMFPIKEYSQTLNLYLLYSTLHPSFFRRLVFRAIENSSHFQYGYGYGECTIDVEKYNRETKDTAIVLYASDSWPEMIEKVEKQIGEELTVLKDIERY